MSKVMTSKQDNHERRIAINNVLIFPLNSSEIARAEAR